MEPGNDDALDDDDGRPRLKLEHFEYPKPLPPIVNETTYDDMGFSELEKRSLLNMWRYVKPHSRRHAINMFRVFYLRNENLLEKFRDANGKIQTSILYKHAHSSLHMYGLIIENALGNPAAYHSLTYMQLTKHRQHQIDRERIILYGESMNEYLVYYLRKHASPTLSKALEKLTLYIAKQHPRNNGTDERIGVAVGMVRNRLNRSTTLAEHFADGSATSLVSEHKSKASSSGNAQSTEADN